MTETEPNLLIGNFTSRQVRIQGGVLLFLGALLAIGLAVVLVNTLPTMLNPGVAIGGSTFTGSVEQARVFIALLVWVLVLGLMFAAVGVQQLMNGRRMKAFLYPTLAVLAIGLLGIAYFRDVLFS